ncbi:MAG: pyruvate dehydrogenase (acetyl-transferring) E1 component subunit alpha [Gammaproteobacteria bacterium]
MTTIVSFSVDYIQYLTPEAKLLCPLPEGLKDPKQLIALYQKMAFLRAFDAKAVILQRTGKLGTYPAALGQEAVSMSMGYAMEPQDVLVPYYRDQGALLERGVLPSEIYAYWGGDERGSSFVSATNPKDFPLCVPIATQLLHAAGVAYAFQLRKQPHAVVTSCGEGGTSEGDFYEAINFAGACQLPVVFVVNNNQWAISVPRSKQTRTTTIAQKAIAGGFEGIQVDGNDVIAMVGTMQAALKKARTGGGPTLIEAITYRLCDHTTADDAKRYVHPDDLKKAWDLEPLKRLQRYLIDNNLWNSDAEASMQQDIEATIKQAVEDYLQLPPAPHTDMLDYLYAVLPKAYQSQRAALMAH